MSHIHLISLPTPFPVGAVNAYLIEGDPLTLIDAGPKHPETWQALEEKLAALKYRVEDIQRLILTHHHVDHIGQAGEIQKRSGAQVFAHPHTVPYLVDYEGTRRSHIEFYRQLLIESGVPDSIKEKIDRSGGGFSKWTEPLTVSGTLHEGDTVSLGGSNWQVYHTPGHAGDLICLFNEVNGELLSNDHLLRDISSNPLIEPPATGDTARPKSLVNYIQHMKRIAALNPSMAYPGHGELIHDVPELVKRRLHFHQRRANKLHELLKPAPLTLWELTTRTFGERLKSGSDFYLGLSEIVGHLDILVEENRLNEMKEGEVVKWKVR